METPTRAEPRPLAPVLRAALAGLPVAAIAWLGSRATLPNIPTWYAGLAKPPLTPPNWLFGPAWALLYSLMAVALFRVLSNPPATPGRGVALLAFAVQLALNGIWSWAFFAARSPGAGLLVIAALLRPLPPPLPRSRASTAVPLCCSRPTSPGLASRLISMPGCGG